LHSTSNVVLFKAYYNTIMLVYDLVPNIQDNNNNNNNNNNHDSSEKKGILDLIG